LAWMTKVMFEKTSSETRISSTIEDYLGIIYVLERDGEPVTGVRLAQLLGVSAPTVTNTLKRMLRDDLITLDAEHRTHLTESGLQASQSVIRRHMLAEWMLSRMLSWSKVHKEAHEFEHAMSGEVEAALYTELNNPEVCPHGNPFPGHEEIASGWIALTDAPVGVPLVIRRIHEFAEDSDKVLAFLEENKIAPGREATILEVLPFNQTMNVCALGHVFALGFSVARYIYAEPKVQMFQSI
jgi:DtxR family transcriptional regulator, Mn-dependent transcriptional regulator